MVIYFVAGGFLVATGFALGVWYTLSVRAAIAEGRQRVEQTLPPTQPAEAGRRVERPSLREESAQVKRNGVPT